MKKTMYAKFKSTCFETGYTINKGDLILYDPAIKKAYCEKSQTFKDHAIRQDDFIQDPADQYFDNFCQQNNI